MAKSKQVAQESFSDLVRATSLAQNISEEQVIETLKQSILAMYRNKFGMDYGNAVVRVADDMSGMEVYARKTIVEEVEDPVLEISLQEAQELAGECDIGDVLDIPLDLKKDFARNVVKTGKQFAQQSFRSIQSDSLYADYESKKGETIIGYYLRKNDKNDTIYVDLGRMEVEGVFPRRFQSPREVYTQGSRIKALVKNIEKTPSGLKVTLSRSDPEFVRKIFETEVAEVADGTVTIHKIVREAGFRTKMAVSSAKEGVDPVGACVGLKGIRIQNVIRELEGEKIDVLRYDLDPRNFIRNALSPAQVSNVVILNADTKQALAIVPDDQFSIAIGKNGLNVKLANRLADWNIDVKSEAQTEEIEELMANAHISANDLFNDEYDEITLLKELPDVNETVVAALEAAGIVAIDDFLEKFEAGGMKVKGAKQADLKAIADLIESISEEEPSDSAAEENSAKSVESEEEYYECPECGARITLDMTKCPNCGVELEFEEDEE